MYDYWHEKIYFNKVMIKKIYNKIKNFFKTFRYYELVFRPIELDQEKMEYILSGIDPKIRKQFDIVYSPTNLLLYKSKENKFKAIKNNLERKITAFTFDLDYEELEKSLNPVKYLKEYKEKLKQRNKVVMENIRLNHLKKMNNFYSDYIKQKISDLEEKFKIDLRIDFVEGLKLKFI